MSSFSARSTPPHRVPSTSPHAVPPAASTTPPPHAAPPHAPSPEAVSPEPPSGGAVSTGSAYGKTILLGEHAVVYGHPAIAAPIPGLQVTVEARRREPAGSADGSDDSGSLRIRDAATGGTTPELARAAPAVEAVCAALGVPTDFLELTVHDDIPHGHGFGSSAAWGVALVRALTRLHGVAVDDAEELGLVAHLEAEAHGKASGVDAHAASAGPGLLRFQEGRSAPLPVPAECAAAVLVVDSGVSASTYETVAAVARSLEQDPQRTRVRIDRIGALATGAEAMLRAGDAIGVGAAMSENHRLLAGLDLSTPEVDALVSAACDAGALGAKVSGGGRGGCVVALCASAHEAAGVGAHLSEHSAGHWIVELSTGRGR